VLLFLEIKKAIEIGDYGRFTSPLGKKDTLT
jgi:hypothetical protein